MRLIYSSANWTLADMTMDEHKNRRFVMNTLISIPMLPDEDPLRAEDIEV